MAQDTVKYWFTLETECGRQLPVNFDWYGKNFDGNSVFIFELGDKQITFTINDMAHGYRERTLTDIIGEVDVNGHFGAYLTRFTYWREGRTYFFEYRLKGGIERSVYDYLTEVGV